MSSSEPVIEVEEMEGYLSFLRSSAEGVQDGWDSVQASIQNLIHQDEIMRDSVGKLTSEVVNPDIVPWILISGSMAEGASTARWFQQNKTGRELEMDIMYNIVQLPPAAENDVLDPSHSDPGYTWVHYDSVYVNQYNSKLKEILEDHYQDKEVAYLDASVIKEMSSRFIDFPQSSNTHTAIKLLCSVFLGVKPLNTKMTHAIKETATTSELTIVFSNTQDNELLLEIATDHVPSVKLQFWPAIASEWVTRERKWPSLENIKTIVLEGCHLVPKCSPRGDPTKEWRFSFSAAEIMLCRLRSEKQKMAYNLFKILFYKYLKPLKDENGKTLFSYLAKSIMLWLCEKHPPEDPIWNTLESAVEKLLENLQECLEQQMLRNFFIPSINLLEGASPGVCSHATDIIKLMRKRLLWFMPIEMEEVEEKGKYFANKFTIFYTVGKLAALLRGCKTIREAYNK